MRLLGLKTFRHGVHPPESKDETSGLAIRQFPFAPLLIVPLVQHMGAPSLPRGGGRGGSSERSADRARRRLHVGLDARPRFGSDPQDCPGPQHQRPHGAGGVPGAVCGRHPGGRGRHTLSARQRNSGRDHRRHPGCRCRRARGRGVPDAREAQDPRGQVRRHPDHQRDRVRAVPHHRSSGDAGAEQGHLRGDSLPVEGHGGEEGHHRHRGQQARRRGALAPGVPRRLGRLGGGAAGEVPTGRREDVVLGASRTRGAVPGTASRYPRPVLQRRHRRTDRSPASSRTGDSRTGDHGDGACGEA